MAEGVLDSAKSTIPALHLHAMVSAAGVAGGAISWAAVGAGTARKAGANAAKAAGDGVVERSVANAAVLEGAAAECWNGAEARRLHDRLFCVRVVEVPSFGSQ